MKFNFYDFSLLRAKFSKLAMVNLFFGLALLPLTSQAQPPQKYFMYRFNDQYGLSDMSGTQIIKEDFERFDDQVDQYALFSLKNNKRMLIDLHDGTKILFDDFEPNAIFVNQQYFANASQNGKHFLWNQQTRSKVALPSIGKGELAEEVYLINKDYLYAVGKETIFAKQTKKAPVKKANTSGVPRIEREEPLAPPVENTYVYIFKNDLTMPLVSKIKIDSKFWLASGNPNSIFSFYNYSNTPKVDATKDAKQVEVVYKEKAWTPGLKPWHFYYDESFNIATVVDGDSIRILDENLKVLKTILKKDGEDDRNYLRFYLEKKFPNDDVSLKLADFYPNVSFSGLNPKDLWTTKHLDDGKIEFSLLIDDKYVPILVFEGKEITMNRNYRINFTAMDDQDINVQLDPKTLKIAMPEQYKQQFKITRIEN